MRKPRWEFSGGVYHVINRGLERRAIVSDDGDRRNWARLFDRVADRHGWRVFAYVLLDNHFHIFLRTPQANLSTGMHDFQSGYATLFNKRHNRCGPLFQGRFKSVLVESDGHCWELSRYIHLNPVRAGETADPFQYRWSSYHYYLNAHGAPAWLDWRTVLAEIGRTEAAARVAYKRFVEAGIQNPPSNPLDNVVDGWILGSDSFVERMHATLDDPSLHDEPSVDSHLTREDVVRAVASACGVTPDQIRARGRQHNEAREAAIWLIRDLLGEPIAAMGEYFGGVGKSTVSETIRRVRQRTDGKLDKLINQVKRDLER